MTGFIFIDVILFSLAAILVALVITIKIVSIKQNQDEHSNQDTWGQQ
ncbi:hypothetical protein THIOSC15_2720010 [uncultured Thiomicrorhabdus sp.]